MDTTFFNVLVHTVNSSIDARFGNLGEVKKTKNKKTKNNNNNKTKPKKIEMLLNFPRMKKKVLKPCQTLSPALTHDRQADVDGTEPAMEMYNFQPLPSKNTANMILLTFLYERKLTEMYPNM